MKIYSIKKCKKKPKSHVGKMEGAYTEPGGSGKIDTRLTPVHRYTLEEKEKPVITTKK
jgi:hypothetical protein